MQKYLYILQKPLLEFIPLKKYMLVYISDAQKKIAKKNPFSQISLKVHFFPFLFLLFRWGGPEILAHCPAEYLNKNNICLIGKGFTR